MTIDFGNKGKSDIEIELSNIETIDSAMFRWLQDEMNVQVTTNRGWIKVPTIWVAGERSLQSKDERKLRDRDGALILPVLTIERTSMVKDMAKKGSFQANIFPNKGIQGGVISYTRKINQTKTKDFAASGSIRKYGQKNNPNKDNNKVVYQTIYTPMPVYIDVVYSIKARAEYQQQINEIIQPFMSFTGGINSYIIEQDGHSYEAFIQQDFSHDSNVTEIGEEERRYEMSFTVNVLGYLLGEGKNRDKPKVAVRENAVEFKFTGETVAKGDIP